MSFHRPPTARHPTTWEAAVAKSEPGPIAVSEYVLFSAASLFFYKC